MCVSRSISRLSRCFRSPIPVKVGAYTSCPALRSLGASFRQTTLPAQEPCTRTNVAVASSPHNTARRWVVSGFEEIVSYCYGRRHLGEKIRLDRAPQVAVDRLGQRDGSSAATAMASA